MMFEIIHDLCESKSFRSETILDKLSDDSQKELLALHMIAIFMMMQDERFKTEAKKYGASAIAFNNFDYFRGSCNDLYVLLYSQNENQYFKSRDAITNIRNAVAGNYVFLYQYINKLCSLLKTNSVEIRNTKRMLSYYNNHNESVVETAYNTIFKKIRSHMPRSELYAIYKNNR
jgi:hypothetical protein